MSFLFPKVKTPKPEIDRRVIEPSVRGSICPLSLGVNRVSPVIGWVGNTVITVREEDSGGKGGGGGDSTYTYIYSMSGMHLLSIGEGAAITRISQGGKSIFEGRLTPDNLASGAEYSLGAEGTFRVYWGGNNPAIAKTYNMVDARLAGFTGVSSRYPYMFYIVWDTKTLGEQKTWPNLEYEIQVNPQLTTLFGESSLFDMSSDSYSVTCDIDAPARHLINRFGREFYYNNISVIMTTNVNAAYFKTGWLFSGTINGVSFSSSIIEIIKSGSVYSIATKEALPSAWYEKTGTIVFSSNVQKGVNPIAIIYQLLFETYPHGLGLSTTYYNLADMETLFDYFRATGTALPASIYLKEGQSHRDGISAVMQDAGILMGWDCVTGKYRFTRPLSTDVATEIPEESYNLGNTELETDYDQLDADLRTYNFIDANRKFMDSTILVTDDGKGEYTDYPNAKKTELKIVRDLSTASMVAAYRDREDYGRSSIDITIPKSLLILLPGGLFSFENLPGKYRLIEKQVIPDNASIKAEFKEDVYSELSPYVIKEPSGLFPSDSLGAELDLQTALFEVSRYTHPDTQGVFFIRVRANPQIVGTFPYISNNDITYNQLEVLNTYVVGGELSEAIDATGAAILTSSPEFTVNGPDVLSVLDLSSEDDKVAWKNGEQMCLIDNELFFLRGITPVVGVDAGYTLDGLIRARLGTAKAAHSTGAKIYIFKASALKIINSTLLVAGSTIYAKSQPYSVSSTVELSDAEAVSITYSGGGYRPLPIVNLSTADRTRGFVVGTDVSIRWGYRNVVGGAGAGLGLSDEVYNAPLPEGYFKLEFRTTGGTLVRTVDNILTAAYTYPDADRISDFSGNSFKIRVYNILNGLVSEYDEITITPAGA